MKNLKSVIVLISLLFCVKGFGQTKNEGASLLDYLKQNRTNTFKDYVQLPLGENKLLILFNDANKVSYAILNRLLQKELNIKIKDLKYENVIESKIEANTFYEAINDDVNKVFSSKKEINCYEIKNEKKSIYFIIENGGLFVKKYSDFTTKIYSLIEASKDEYDCKNGKAGANKVINNNLKGIKSTIFFGSADAINSNSAISYLNTSEGDKINIGFNYNYNERHFLNTSIYKNSKGAYFFSNDGWQNNIGASFTYNLVKKASQYYITGDCNTLEEKRNDFYKEIKNDLIIFKKQKEAIKIEIDTLKAEKLKMLETISLTIKDSNRLEVIDSLITKYTKIQKKSKQAFLDEKKYIQDRINKFDSINDVLQGHYLFWTTITGNIENQNLKLDSLNGVLLDNPTKNIPKLKIGVSGNLSSFSSNNKGYKKYKNGYIQGFANISMSSFLESIQKDRKPVLKEVDDEIFVYDNQNNQLGRYQDLKRAYWTANLGANFTTFIISKNIGFAAIYNHSFALQDLDFVDYKNRYSAQVGLVFRAQVEKDVNKATFRILAGAEDLLYNQKTFKEASVKISVAIPFNVFTKK
ncbi:hypothetical protein [uncultured Lacinutrix sp.]|uniref:hypothetical protein n=1 Tax=uncultured Lacinutrix sp. TaxID=574032 RepID=UPI00262E1B80|nr:hypothetical protein [uncultured Lacinutrix sp.]